MNSVSDPCWETNGKWNPTLIQRVAKPSLTEVLGGTHEDFRSDGTVSRFRVVMRKPDDIPSYVHARLEIEMFDWWWIDLPDGMVAVSFRLDAHKKWKIIQVVTAIQARA